MANLMSDKNKIESLTTRISELEEEVRHLKNELEIALRNASSEKLRFLSKSAFQLIGFDTKEAIFSFIGQSLHEIVKESIVFVNEANTELNGLTLKYIYGIEGSLFDKALKLVGYNPLEETVPIFEEYKALFLQAKLIEFKKGLEEFAKDSIPRAVAKGLHVLLGLNKIYTIGIERNGDLFAVIHIFTRKNSVVEDIGLIETFINQCSIALQRKQLENELVHAKNKAEESDKLKSAFLANMSHEIRTPLNAVLGFAELLKEDNVSEENRKVYIDHVCNGGEQLLRLINDIVDLSKIEASQLSLYPESFNLRELFEELFEQFKLSNTSPGVKMSLRIDSKAANESVYTDKNRLVQILSNLVSNAQKFTKKGSIEIGYQIDNEQITFFVKDTGIGIEKKEIDRVFDRFHQTNNALSRFNNGTGLGLSIAKGLVELLDGKIWVESKLGKGSEFYFTIHRHARVNDKPEKKKIQNLDSPYLGSCTILIAEDEEINFEYLKRLLVHHTVLHATNGKEAIEMLSENSSIDLIFMDIKMPVMGGIEATKEIRKWNSNTPIIAQSAFAFNEDKEKALAAGCNDYISKPFSKIRVLEVMNKYLPK